MKWFDGLGAGLWNMWIYSLFSAAVMYFPLFFLPRDKVTKEARIPTGTIPQKIVFFSFLAVTAVILVFSVWVPIDNGILFIVGNCIFVIAMVLWVKTFIDFMRVPVTSPNVDERGQVPVTSPDGGERGQVPVNSPEGGERGQVPANSPDGGERGQVPADRLVTGGMYSVSRNPMYVTETLVFLGIGITGASFPLVVLSAVYAVLAHLITLAEEKDLAKRFGREYDDYRRSVGRYF